MSTVTREWVCPTCGARVREDLVQAPTPPVHDHGQVVELVLTPAR